MRPGAIAAGAREERGSTFVIVLWIALGLVSLALYFAQSTSFELRAADSRVCGMAADQAIDAAVRYLQFVLVNYETNGVAPDPSTYLCEAVPVGDSHFWFLGRDTNDMQVGPSRLNFGLVSEASKVNLNTASSNMLAYVPYMTPELTQAIIDWRDTNGGSGTYQMYYGIHNPPYQAKSAPFESIEELKLVYGGDLYTLMGEDLNRNGVLDPNEIDENHNGRVDPGVLEYVTIYSREPSTYSNGTARVSIRSVGSTGPLATLLQSTFGQSQADRILGSLGVLNVGGRPGSGPGGGPGRGTVVVVRQFASPLEFYRASQMSADDFAKIENAITAQTATNYIEGRINVNTASAEVLGVLPGLTNNPGLVQTLLTYRQQNPYRLQSIGWVVDALGQNNSTVLDALQAEDCITTQSYQFSADVIALGPHGRGYRRVRFILDTVDGTPKVVYRQDLTHLGWALGKEARQKWLLAKDTR
jgi:DNA uptake protein ComE-like DNA-binding protein